MGILLLFLKKIGLWTITQQQLDNLDKMNTFLETQNPVRESHEKIENLNKSITIKEIEFIIKHLLTKKEKKYPKPGAFFGEFISLLNYTKQLKKNTNL